MANLKPRDPRKSVAIKVRMRSDLGWQDVTILNVSRRGLMLRADTLPAKGNFIEVRHRSICMVGRVAWSTGSRCGVRTQDTVDVEGLLSASPGKPHQPSAERRAAPRAVAAPPAYTLAQREERSRRFAQVLNWSIVAIGGGVAALALAQVAVGALNAPLDQARTALAQRP